MNIIVNWLMSLVQFIFMLFKFLLMVIGGLTNLGTILMESVNVLMEVIDFLPLVVRTTFMAVLGIMVTLRILGAIVHV